MECFFCSTLLFKTNCNQRGFLLVQFTWRALRLIANCFCQKKIQLMIYKYELLVKKYYTRNSKKMIYGIPYVQFRKYFEFDFRCKQSNITHYIWYHNNEGGLWSSLYENRIFIGASVNTFWQKSSYIRYILRIMTSIPTVKSFEIDRLRQQRMHSSSLPTFSTILGIFSVFLPSSTIVSISGLTSPCEGTFVTFA